MKDTSFSVAKALAIFFMVLAHSGCPSWISGFVSMFHMPFFFICAGYFFKAAYWDNGQPFVERRIKRLYVPFVKWSVVMLCLHNVLSLTGIISGRGSELYDWHTFFQHVWSCLFNMSGYDNITCGAYWFFRTLLLVSLAYWLLGALLRRLRLRVWHKSLFIGIPALLMAVWMCGEGLRMTGVAQGGYRELMGLYFFSCGAIYHELEPRIRHQWAYALGGLVVLVVFQLVGWRAALTYTSTVGRCFSLALTGLLGFMMLRVVSLWLVRLPEKLVRPLAYIGEHTLYIFAFHALAFRLVSMIKVGVYHLPWSQMGNQMVVTHRTDDAFFLLYTLFGMAVPLLVRIAWRRYDNRSAMAFCQDTWRSVKKAYRDIMAASDTKDE